MNEIQTLFNNMGFKSLSPLNDYFTPLALLIGITTALYTFSGLVLFLKYKKLNLNHFSFLPQNILMGCTLIFFLVSTSNKEIEKQNLEIQKYNETLFIQFKNSLTDEQKQLLSEKLSEQHLTDSYEDVSKLFKEQL